MDLQAHSEVVGLLVLAVVGTMPDEPPERIRAIPGWLYRWIHDAAKTFLSFRGPRVK